MKDWSQGAATEDKRRFLEFLDDRAARGAIRSFDQLCALAGANVAIALP
jgi:hypothetical protein